MITTSDELDYARTRPATPSSRPVVGQAALRDFVRVVLAVIVLPELPQMLWHVRTHLPSQMAGAINSEYLLLLAVACLFPSWRMITLLAAELMIVALEPIAALYNVPLRDAFHVLRNLTLLPPSRLATYASLLLLYAVTCTLLLRLSVGLRRRTFARPLAAALLILAMVPILADVAEGRYYRVHLSGRPSDVDRLLPYQAAAMPVFHLGKELVLASVPSGPAATSRHPLPSTLGRAMSELPANTRPDIVLVVTESWGLADDERVNQAAYRAYRDPAIAENYRVEVGQTQFDGGTIASEFRELCAEAGGFDVLTESAENLRRCWPARLGADGYSTLAVHGFSSLMFGRRDWYNRLGFKETEFLDELSRTRLAHCEGAFNGMCDADVADWIGDRLLAPRGPGPTYVHWVTLNTHLPIASLAPDASRQDCAESGIDGETSLCSWLERTLVVHRSVAALANRPGLRPTVFVIVGDHAPPFLNVDFRTRFSATHVPYVILMPKSLSKPEPGRGNSGTLLRINKLRTQSAQYPHHD